MACLLEQRWVRWVGMESRQSTLRNIVQSITRRETEETVRLVLGRTHNGQRLWQHHLVGAVRVQVHARQERRLTGMSLKS